MDRRNSFFVSYSPSKLYTGDEEGWHVKETLAASLALLHSAVPPTVKSAAVLCDVKATPGPPLSGVMPSDQSKLKEGGSSLPAGTCIQGSQEPWGILLGGLNMAEEIYMEEEPNVNIEQSVLTMEEPTPGTKERKEQISCQSNKQNEKLR